MMSMPGRNKRKERSLPEPEPEPLGIPSSSADDHHLSSSSSADHSLSSPPSTRRLCFPPGFNYTPNDLEVFLLLCRKRDYLGGNRDFLVDLPIHLVNIYESNPEELTVKFKKGNDTDWFFVSKRNKMGQDGKRQKRGDKGGYWHATVASKKIDAGQGLVGYKTALDYYVGKQPNGKKTSWLMHEYWIDQCPPSADDDVKDYSMCKIYRSTQAINKKRKAEEEENEQQQPPTVEYHQPQPQPHHDTAYQQQPLFQPAPLDSYQSQPRDLAYQEQQQFWPGPLDSYRPHQWQFWASRPDSHQLQPHYDYVYQQLIRTLEEENVGVQQQQPSLAPPPPPQGQDLRSAMTRLSNDNSTEEDLFDMSDEDRFFDVDALFSNEEEEEDGVDTQQQQQEQSTPIPPPQGQQDDSTSSGNVMTNEDYDFPPYLWNPAEFFDIDELLADMNKGHNMCGPQDNV